MTNSNDPALMDSHKFWIGKRTRHTVEILGYDGTVDDGGVVFVKRVETDTIPTYRLVNIVDLLLGYDPVPNIPKPEQLWRSVSSEKIFSIRDVIEQETHPDNPWVIFISDDLMTTYADRWKTFIHGYEPYDIKEN